MTAHAVTYVGNNERFILIFIIVPVKLQIDLKLNFV